MKLQKLRSPWLVLVVLLICGSGGYLLASQFQQGLGFPLDDAWIHQTYARNLGYFGEWAFIRGQPSGGSTAPAWTFWLSLGYVFRLNPFLWAFLSGVIALGFLAYFGAKLTNRITEKNTRIPWFGVFLIGEWHLLWAALSGMETILLALLIIVVFFQLANSNKNQLLTGALIGLSCWIRPDGITLLGPLALLITLDQTNRIVKFRNGFFGILGFLLLFIPYLIFNQINAGSLWPNTFYAKQAEYAILLRLPFFTNAAALFTLPLVGAGIILLPGFLYAVYRFIKSKHIWGIAAILWWIGYTLIYILRLPVTYQHGRYLIPAMTIFWAIGWVGSGFLLEALHRQPFFRNITRFAGKVAISMVWIGFILIGGRAYSEDVAIINTEMVQTAKWIAENTPPEALIAAHDIGAMGYFADRKLIDLAGLISPEVIPFIRDEERLYDFVKDQEVEYLVTFPEWYPEMIAKMTLIYQSCNHYSTSAGGENMAVYGLR